VQVDNNRDICITYIFILLATKNLQPYWNKTQEAFDLTVMTVARNKFFLNLIW